MPAQGEGMIGGMIGGSTGIAAMYYGHVHSKRDEKALAEMEKNRPVYTRPEEAKQLLELYKTQANNRELPGQSQYESNIQQASASGQSNIQNMTESPTSSIGAMQDLYKNEMNAYNNLAVQQQQYYQQNQDKLGQALSESAKYTDMEFEYNTNSPWQRKYQNKINELLTHRSMLQQGTATLANSGSNTNFGGSPATKSNANFNYGQMNNDYNSAVQSGQGYDYESQGNDYSQNQSQQSYA
jgi:DNA repair ATPase RecN